MIKEFIKRTNALAIFSFLLAIFAWLFSFSFARCGDTPSLLSGAAAIIGMISLVWIKIKKQKGSFLAISSIILGIAGYILLVTLC